MEQRGQYKGPGRPDVMQWFRHIRSAKPGLDAAVNLCGRQSLKNDARRAAARMSGEDGLFFVEEEVFEVGVLRASICTSTYYPPLGFIYISK